MNSCWHGLIACKAHGYSASLGFCLGCFLLFALGHTCIGLHLRLALGHCGLGLCLCCLIRRWCRLAACCRAVLACVAGAEDRHEFVAVERRGLLDKNVDVGGGGSVPLPTDDKAMRLMHTVTTQASKYEHASCISWNPFSDRRRSSMWATVWQTDTRFSMHNSCILKRLQYQEFHGRGRNPEQWLLACLGQYHDMMTAPDDAHAHAT